MGRTVDLRTDALTVPTEAMWDAMREADFGWSDDERRHVTELEALGAELLGMEAALLLSTCSVANLLALLSLAERGSQVILEESSHMVCMEEWGLAYVGAVFPRLVAGDGGVLSADTVADAIAAGRAISTSRTSAVCIENSHNNAGGTVTSAAQVRAIVETADRHGVAVHVDGARLFNAAVAQGVPPSDLTAGVASVAVSLNKGISAPWGALLCGSRDLIGRARLNARRLGVSSVHKEGMFAAAAIVGLTSMIDQLAEDNRRAAAIAAGLSQLDGLAIELATVQTNIVLVDTCASGLSAAEFVKRLGERDVLALGRSGDYQVRLVTHRGIEDADVEHVVAAARDCLREPATSDVTVGFRTATG